MPKLRHIAIASHDPVKTAKFYETAFDFKELKRFGDFAGNVPGKSYGIYLTDGTINMAVIKFGWSQGGKSLDYEGIHHFGIAVEDADTYIEKLEAMGAECVAGKPDDKTIAFYEVKFVGPDGVLFDIADSPWAGTEPLPGQKKAERHTG